MNCLYTSVMHYVGDLCYSSKLHTRVLEVLHIGHLLVVKMKTLARSFVWWTGTDQQIQHLVREYGMSTDTDSAQIGTTLCK